MRSTVIACSGQASSHARQYAVAAASMLQCFSNQRSMGVAALLPSNLLLYALLAPDSAMVVAAANWLESALSAVPAPHVHGM